jgi:hypothetical protein
MNPDLHMAEDLKNTGKGNLFVVFGEPDVEILDAPGGEIKVKVHGVDVFDPSTGEIRSDDVKGIAAWFIDRLRRGKLLRPPRLFPRRERSLQVAEDGAEGGNRSGCVGDALCGYVAAICAAEHGTDRGEGD